MCNFVKILMIGWIGCCCFQFNFNRMSDTLLDVERVFISSVNQPIFNRFQTKNLS